MTLLLGFAYSFCLRIVIMIGLVVFVVPWVLALGAHSESVKQLKPNVGRLINTAALTGDPVYFVLCLTLISFVVAALREELWRAGMIAGVRQLFPRLFASVRGKIAAVMIVALIFGLGHTLQGWSGVAIATVLGVGLGLIMVRHRSIWEAVIAHGFFDAGTFALMFLIAKFLPGQHT